MAAAPRPQVNDTIEFTRRRAPLAIFFLVVPALVLVMIVATVVTHRFPPVLLGLLAAVGASCAFWVKTSLEQIGSVVVEMAPQELRIKRLLGGVSYAWSDIDTIKLVDPGASLSDSGRQDGGRVGIGLYLRTKNQNRTPEQPPDEIIITATQDGAAMVIKAGERIIAFHRKAATKAAGSNFGKTGKGFRRPAKAA